MGSFGKIIRILSLASGIVILVFVGVQFVQIKSAGTDEVAVDASGSVSEPMTGAETGAETAEAGDTEAERVEEEVAAPPEDAGIGELAVYYFERASVWLFGEKEVEEEPEETIQMDCKTKQGGGKSCSITRS
ncbi:hypothetical protein [Celeribacter sp. ULVN23_4]